MLSLFLIKVYKIIQLYYALQVVVAICIPLPISSHLHTSGLDDLAGAAVT